MFRTLLVLFCVNYMYVILIIAKSRHEKDNNETICKEKVCNKDCKKLNYTRGFCYNNTLCYCDEGTNGTAKYDSIKTKCEQNVCLTDCVELGYPGGKCVDADICFCDAKTTGNKSASNESNETCYHDDCKLACRTEGYHNAVCIESTCYCNSTNSSNVPTKPDIVPASTECVKSNCNRDCQSLNYPSGACGEDDEVCYCEYDGSAEDLPKPTTSTTTPKPIQPIVSCNDSICDKACKDQSFISGSCSKNDCNCIAQVECKDQRCKQACEDDGFSGGECRTGDCYCKPKRFNQKDKIPA